MKTIMILVLLLAFNVCASGQDFFSIHVGPSIPNGDFADDDVDTFLDGDTGAAALGFNIGARFRSEINDNGLGWFVGVDFSYNPISDDLQDSYEELWSDFYDSYDVTFTKIINVPVSVGIDYIAPSSSNVAFYGNGGIVLNFLKLTNLEASANEDGTSEAENYDFDLSTNIGIKLGAGILINEKYRVELNYFGIGEHEVEGDYSYDYSFQGQFEQNESDTFDVDKKVSFITLTFGLVL